MKAAVTFDIDWAPDCAIDFAANLLAERGVKSTWFVTHLSPAVERLRSCPDLFELGIHPNFMPKSSHGVEPEQVLKTCMEFVPEAVSVRTHGLLQSGSLFDLVMSLTPVTFDVSLFHPRALQIEVIKYERQHEARLQDENFLRKADPETVTEAQQRREVLRGQNYLLSEQLRQIEEAN